MAAHADLHARLRAHAEQAPERTALTFAPAHLDGARITLTYGEVVRRSLAAAARLRERLAPGDRAMLMFPAVPEFADAFLGCLAAGVIAVPVPPPLDESAQRRVRAVARDCGVSAIVSLSFVHDLALAGSELTRALAEEHPWILLDDAAESDVDEQLPTIAQQDVAFLQYTSGSTSTPRGVVVTHGSLMANEAAIEASFGVHRDSAIVSWLPLHHDMGLIGGLLQPLYAGARGVVLDPLSFVRRPAYWLETVSAEHADISGGPNFAYDLCARKVTEQDKAGLDLSGWRVAFNGAAQVYPETLRRFTEAMRGTGFQARAHTPCYGLAEATLLVTCVRPDDEAPSTTFTARSLEAGAAEPSATGRELVRYPLPAHAQVAVVDPATGAPVPEGRTGELVVAGASNGSGYWGAPDAGERTFGLRLPGSGQPYLRTGDLGFLRDGALHIQGRAKDLIVQRGRNLHPEDLEADVARCAPEIRPGCGAVFAVEHDGDEAVVVCQEIRSGTEPSRHPDITSGIREVLSRVHGVVPHAVVLVPPRTIAKTSSGKVQRHAAKARFLTDDLPVLYTAIATRDDAGPTVAQRLRAEGGPLTADRVSRAVRERLADALGLPTVPGADVSLAALGADSLFAVQLQHEVEEALDVSLAPTAMLRAGSLADLVTAALAAPRTERTEHPEHPEHTEHTGHDGYELTAAQEALWFLHRAFPDSSAYVVTRAFRVDGPVSLPALQNAVDAVVARHAGLRIAITAGERGPRALPRDDRQVTVTDVDGTDWDDDRTATWYRDLATTPFDLEHDPLLRVTLLRRATDHLLVLSLHHIVCDVASLAVLVADLADAYRGVPLGPSPAVSPAEVGAQAVAAREDELAGFWSRELAGELPTLVLPRLGEPSGGAAASRSIVIDPRTTGALAAFARESGLTLHAVLLAAYQVVLHRLSGQDDVIVGVPAAGRQDRRLTDWVGYLVNVLPVRSAAPKGSFAAFARRTHERMLDALDHQALPLARITRLVNPERSSAAATLFQAMFSFYTTALPGGAAAAAAVTGDPGARLRFGAATMAGHPMPDHTTQSDLGLNVVARAADLAIELQYDPAAVSAEQAERVVTTFGTLLAAIADRPDTAAPALPLLTPAEANAVVAAGFGPEVPRPQNYVDHFELIADGCPTVVAAADGSAEITYGELDRRANHVAALLRESGVDIDGNVVVSAARGIDYLVALLGIHKADGCYVPISPREAPRRAAAMVTAVAPAAVIACPAGRPLVTAALADAGSTAPVFDLAELAGGQQASRVARTSPPHAASTIIHTSGSTGVPKAAVSTNYGVTNHMWQLVEHFGLGAADCVAQTAPVSFDISVWQLLTPLMLGARVRIVPEPDSQSPANLLRAVVDGGVTMLELVPSNIVALLDAGLAADPGALRVMLSTGEALTGDVLRRWVRELPHVPVHNAYGPAECTDDVTAGLCAAGPDGPMTTSVGVPLANTTVLVLDPELTPVPPGVVGTLHVGGGAVGRGYRGNPRRTAEVFVPDPYSAVPGGRLYRTGDLGRRDAAGMIEFLGRADTQIKIRGQRIEAGEVEAALRRCASVPEAAVKVHNGPLGATLVGYLGTGTGSGTGDAVVLDAAADDDLRRELALSLPRHMIPSMLATLPRLPRSKNGKVDYPGLRYAEPRSDGDTQRNNGPAAEFGDPVAAAVRTLWADLLGREHVGDQESFFQLGGHSLLALTMIDRVCAATGVDLAVDAVFAHPRLGEFVEAVRHADPATPAAPGRSTSNGGPVPASAAQQRFWYLHEVDPGRPTYNMPGVLRLRGVLDEDALDAALHEVLDRHPVLLARFTDHDGELAWTPAPHTEFELARLDLRGPVAEFGDAVFDRLVADEAEVVADLRHGIPFRALLARLGPKDWGLHVTIDHIACDGWSLTVFLTDLAHAYNRRMAEDDRPANAAPAYGFADFCHDERAWRAGRDPAAVAEQWRGVVDGRTARSPLPATTNPEPGAGRHTLWVGDELATAVGALAGRAGTTPYLVFATALAALTHSGADERETVLLGTLIAQRDRPRWRSLVGPLLNVSVLAVDVGLADDGGEALWHTRDGALRAYRCAHVPFQELAPLVTTGGGEPFDVLLVMQPDGTPAEFDGLTTELSDVDTDAAPYPLTVDIERVGDRYRVSLRFATDRYAAEDVQAFAGRLLSALRALTADPDRTVAELRTAEETEGADR